MPRHHLTSLILKYAGDTLLGCSALVTQSWTVYWSPAECGGAARGLSWPAAPRGAASIGPERPWEAPGPLLFKVSPLCHWGSWAERGIQRAFRAKTRRLKRATGSTSLLHSVPTYSHASSQSSSAADWQEHTSGQSHFCEVFTFSVCSVC